MQQVTEVYEVRITLGQRSNVSFNALFCGRPQLQDIIAAIRHSNKTARVFKIASPDSFIEIVKRLGVPRPNHAYYNTDGSCVHIIKIDLFPVISGEVPK